MIGRSKELEDVGRVASSFPTCLGKIEATLLAVAVPRSLTQNATITVLILLFYSALLKATLVPKSVSSGC